MRERGIVRRCVFEDTCEGVCVSESVCEKEGVGV